MWKNKLANCVACTKQYQNIYARHLKLTICNAAQSYSKVKANTAVTTFCRSKSTQPVKPRSKKSSSKRNSYNTWWGAYSCGGLRWLQHLFLWPLRLLSYLLFLFYRLWIFLARQWLSRVGSFQSQGNIDSQFWGKKLKGAGMKNTRHLLRCQSPPT